MQKLINHLSEVKVLPEEVHELMQNIPPGIIAVDGELRAGKTTLSNKLSTAYGLPAIHLDEFLNRGQNQYVSAIRINELKKSIQNQKLPVIVEGVCLLTILSRIEVVPILHFFLYRGGGDYYRKKEPLAEEINKYIKESHAPSKADKVIIMSNSQTNQLDVDIVYIKSKTIVSVILAFGGVVALLVGAYILSSGISTMDSAVFEILGTKITTEGIGAVILSSSIFWAYFSYLSRPNYSRHREVHSSITPDGSQSTHESERSTMAAVHSGVDDSKTP